MKNYTALIIDLKKSRSFELGVRNSIQNYIISVIHRLNNIFANSLAKNVEFSAGDEVQGLFYSPESAYLYYRMLCMLISPVEARAGIGIGEWNVIIEDASTTAQDGPAYHNARHALNNVKKDASGYYVLIYSKKDEDLYLNALINTSIMLTNNLNEYQNELMLLLELLYPIAIQYEKIDIFELVKLKSRINYYKRNKAVKTNLFDKIIFTDYMNIEPNPIDVTCDGSNFYVSSGKKRGMATQLAVILNKSRQSIEKTIKTANIFEARNLTIAALKFMKKYLKEAQL